ncbi:MAG: glycosylhydrolase-like jelly roll fold domain-containing protein, partial [Candidatus Aminicenantales bacterium]
LDKMAVAPDFSSDVPLRWIHRRAGATEIYFVANPEPRAVNATAVFRVSGLSPELWDPLEGTNRGLAEYSVSDGRTSVPLRFEPHQSFFIVFRNAAPPASSADPAPASAANFPVPVEIASLEGPWDIAFDPKWGGPEKITFEALDDWSRRPEAGVKYYAGTATYAKTFDLPKAVADAAKSGRVWLDLGTVKNIAGVRLNGRDLGVVWCDPWRVEITEVVKPAGNRLEIRVANLWPNRLIGDEQEPPDAEYAKGGNLARWPDWLLKGEPRPSAGRLAFSTWKHYDKDSPLLPSGLLGPVRFLHSPRG